MQSTHEMTDGKARLAEIIASFPATSPHWNEAQNRFQFVDRLLLECLGWEHPILEVERRDDSGGRADYILGSPAKGVVEAKREAVAFNFPAAPKGAKVRKLQTLVDADTAFRDAVMQVIQYCAMHGAQLAAVCNGPQLVVFQAIIPGHSPLVGECYVFDGFSEMVTQFPLLWNILSPEGVAENRAYETFLYTVILAFRKKRQPAYLSRLDTVIVVTFRKT